MVSHGSQDDPLKGAWELSKVDFGWGNVVEFGAQNSSLVRSLGIRHLFCALIIFFISI